jgi:hypothetical protein
MSLWCRDYGVLRDNCTVPFTVQKFTCFFCTVHLSDLLFTIKVDFTSLSDTWFYDDCTNGALLCCCMFQKTEQNEQSCGHRP